MHSFALLTRRGAQQLARTTPSVQTWTRSAEARALAVGKRRLTTAAAETAKPPPSATGEGEEHLFSLRTRIILFTTFSVSLTGGTFAYYLSTDYAFLRSMRETAPGLVNFVAPYLGLPVAYGHGEVVSSLQAEGREYSEDEIEGPHDIRDVVEENISVAVTFAGGQAVIVTVDPHASASQVEALAREQASKSASSSTPLGAMQDFVLLELARAEKLKTLDTKALADELGAGFGVRIPEMPTVINEHTVSVALELCQQAQVDIMTRLQIAQRQGPSEAHQAARLQAALTQLEARWKQLMAELDNTRKSAKKGWFS